MGDIVSESGTGRLTRGLRERLQEMTAASHALAPAVTGNGKAEEYLAVLDRAICAQLRLLRQADLSARLNSPDEVRLDRAPVDLAVLGRDVMKSVDTLTRPQLDIRAEFSSPLAALPAVADVAALRDMLLEFISNSVRAIGRTGAVRLKLERQRDEAVFTVTDTGGGVDPAALDVRDEAEEPEELSRGLLLAKRIAELHGGRLMAGNTGAGGACVAVVIPIVERMGGALRSPAIPVETGGGWDPALVALSGCLPAAAFLPDGRKP